VVVVRSPADVRWLDGGAVRGVSRVDNVYFYDTIGRGYDDTHGVGKTQVVAVSAGWYAWG
jgi:hypothetical protein